MSCPLCDATGEHVLWEDALCRVILANEPDYPGFLRVILKAHVREMTDLPVANRQQLMGVVFAAEAALREVMQPDKINLASLGNIVPHLHWHVIPRFEDDPHFPNPVWGNKLRDQPHAAPAELSARLAAELHPQGVGRGCKANESATTTLHPQGVGRGCPREGEAVVVEPIDRQQPRSKADESATTTLTRTVGRAREKE